MILEDKDICRTCKDKCCEKSGCDYYIEDFESLKLDYLESRLKQGNISIVSALTFNNVNGSLVCMPFLYLRARNKDRDVVDLFSMKTACSLLTETGCPYSFSERPSGGKYFIPKKDRRCKPLFDQKEKILEWSPYQRILSRLVKRITGKSVDEKLKEDVINTLFNFISKNFEGVSKEEISDLAGAIPFLIEAFPLEADIAFEMHKRNTSNVLMYRPNKK